MKYILWDKKADLYTPGVDQNGKGVWAAEDYIAQKAPWAGHPLARVVILDDIINCGVFMNYDQMYQQYKQMFDQYKSNENFDQSLFEGIEFPADVRGEENKFFEFLAWFENESPKWHTEGVDTNERIAAALELNNLYQEFALAA